MPGPGRKRAGDDVAPVIEGEIVPATLEELDEPSGREGDDELDGDAVEMSEADEDEDDDDEDDEEDEDEDEDAARTQTTRRTKTTKTRTRRRGRRDRGLSRGPHGRVAR